MVDDEEREVYYATDRDEDGELDAPPDANQKQQLIHPSSSIIQPQLAKVKYIKWKAHEVKQLLNFYELSAREEDNIHASSRKFNPGVHAKIAAKLPKHLAADAIVVQRKFAGLRTEYRGIVRLLKRKRFR